MKRNSKVIVIACLLMSFSSYACELNNKNKAVKMKETHSQQTYASSWNDAKQSTLLQYFSPKKIHAQQSVVKQTQKSLLQ